AKDYPTAIGTLSRRIALDPGNDEAYYYRGLCHKELKEFQEAVADLRQAVTLAPSKGDRHCWVAVTMSQAYPGCPKTPNCGMQDSTAAALDEFKATVAVDSTSKNAATSYQQIAFRDHLLKKDWNGAIFLLEKANA